MTDKLTIDELLSDLAALDAHLARLGDERAAMRAQVETYVRAAGSAYVSPMAKAAIVPASTGASYDTRAVDSIIAAMVATGDIDLHDWARQLGMARKLVQRAESLRITWQTPAAE